MEGKERRMNKVLSVLTLLVVVAAGFGLLLGAATALGGVARVFTSAFLIGWHGAANYVKP